MRGIVAIVVAGVMLGGLVAPTEALAQRRRRPVPTATLLERARVQYEEVEYEKALVIYERVLGRKNLTPDQKVTALSGLAFCQVALGDDTKGREAFDQLLAVNPSWELPKGLSPKLVAVFDAARKSATAEVEELSVEAKMVSADPPLIQVIAKGPVDRIARVEVLHVQGDESWPVKAKRLGPDRFEAMLGAAARSAQVVITGYNESGFPMVSEGSLAAPLSLTAPAPVATANPGEKKPPPEAVTTSSGTAADTASMTAAALAMAPEGESPDLGSVEGPKKKLPITRIAAVGVGVLGVGALGGGAYFGTSARNAAQEFNGDPTQFATHSEALAVADRASGHARNANLLYVAGGGLLVTSALLWAMGSDSPSEEGFALGATPDSLTVTAWTRW